MHFTLRSLRGSVAAGGGPSSVNLEERFQMTLLKCQGRARVDRKLWNRLRVDGRRPMPVVGKGSMVFLRGSGNC